MLSGFPTPEQRLAVGASEPWQLSCACHIGKFSVSHGHRCRNLLPVPGAQS